MLHCRSQQFGLALGDQEVQQTLNNPDNPYSLFQVHYRSLLSWIPLSKVML